MIGSLSGGNQQKVVIGKMLATGPFYRRAARRAEPRLIDIGPKAEVFKLLAEGARKGLAVVYSTSEVGECLGSRTASPSCARARSRPRFGPDVTKEQIMAVSASRSALTPMPRRQRRTHFSTDRHPEPLQ